MQECVYYSASIIGTTANPPGFSRKTTVHPGIPDFGCKLPDWSAPRSRAEKAWFRGFWVDSVRVFQAKSRRFDSCRCRFARFLLVQQHLRNLVYGVTSPATSTYVTTLVKINFRSISASHARITSQQCITRETVKKPNQES